MSAFGASGHAGATGRQHECNADSELTMYMDRALRALQLQVDPLRRFVELFAASLDQPELRQLNGDNLDQAIEHHDVALAVRNRAGETVALTATRIAEGDVAHARLRAGVPTRRDRLRRCSSPL